jgi:hypothetical protein
LAPTPWQSTVAAAPPARAVASMRALRRPYERTSATQQSLARLNSSAWYERTSATRQSHARSNLRASTNPPSLPPRLGAAAFGCLARTHHKMLQQPQAPQRLQAHQISLARFSPDRVIHGPHHTLAAGCAHQEGQGVRGRCPALSERTSLARFNESPRKDIRRT